MGSPAHACSGQGQCLLLTWSPSAAPLPPLAQSIIHSGGREHPLCCYYPLPDGGKQWDNLSFHLLLARWDTAGQLAPTAALRAPHGHATRVPPETMAEQGCSPSPDSLQQPAALHCRHCHLDPFHLHTLVSTRDAPQPMSAKGTWRNASIALFLSSRISCETLT